MDETQKQQYLSAMDIQVWAEKLPADTQASLVEQDDWTLLANQVANCQACNLHKTRKQTVFGTGSCQADLMIIGEAPGANEDQQGKPFVGRAGQLLTAMLQAVGFEREKVYITNILKCRPPENRDPTPEEVALCTPFLEKQIALLDIKLVLTLGRIAAHHLLKTDIPMGKLRGKTHYFGQRKTPVIATYHPAYLLRSPREKRKVYEDLLQIQHFVSL